ncbi:hypothetical protein PIB30_051155 [Stylosanthes scabra]|uniref:Retrotransposon Copia-like N-terminal domain-containing protein n=1 Tax=Stylosanthes scabra TaxID=79078 RepID=A0ABU6RIC4_9FABA|nr:hypothetical protein [Stylosanthes scabra]
MLLNALVPLTDKLDENNFSSWRKSILLMIRTLKIDSHLDPSKTPARFEEISTTEDKDSGSLTKIPNDSEAESIVTVKKTKSPTIIKESEKFSEWA